jgi:hypothetical protein
MEKFKIKNMQQLYNLTFVITVIVASIVLFFMV